MNSSLLKKKKSGQKRRTRRELISVPGVKAKRDKTFKQCLQLVILPPSKYPLMARYKFKGELKFISIK